MVESALKQDLKTQWGFDMLKNRLNDKSRASIATEIF